MRRTLSLLWAVGLGSVLPALASETPSCLVSAEVREVGRAPVSNADTAITLHSNQELQVTLNLTNKGQRSDFIVKANPSGLAVTDGALSRSASVPPGASQTSLRVGIRGAELKAPCDPGSRRIAFAIYSKQEPDRLCGTAAVNFLCIESEAVRAAAPTSLMSAMDAGARQTAKADTQAVAPSASGTGAVRVPAPRVIKKDTLIQNGGVTP